MLDAMDFLRANQRELETKWELDFLHDRLEAIKKYNGNANFTDKQVKVVNKLVDKVLLTLKVDKFNEIAY